MELEIIGIPKQEINVILNISSLCGWCGGNWKDYWDKNLKIGKITGIRLSFRPILATELCDLRYLI